jgi:hypothetical protein
LGDPGVDGRIILKWILRKCGDRVWTVLIWLRIGNCTGILQHCNEFSLSIKGGVFLA